MGAHFAGSEEVTEQTFLKHYKYNSSVVIIMKKKFLIPTLILTITLTLAGCMPENRAVEKKLADVEPVNSEWADSIGLLNNENAPLAAFAEKDDIIDVNITCDGGEKSYEALCDIINAHNSFVDANPGYFKEGIEIDIGSTHANKKDTFNTFNGYTDFYGFSAYEAKLGVKPTARINYAYISVMDLLDQDQALLSMNKQFDIPVVILYAGDNISNLGDDTYKVLGKFSGLEQVVLDFYMNDYNPQATLEKILNVAPGFLL